MERRRPAPGPVSPNRDYNDSKFQLVLLDPGQFSGQNLTVHNPITNTKGVYVAGTDGYLRESPGNINCPIIPTMPFYEGRPRAAHRNNPFYVALSSAFIFLRYQSDPTRFNAIPEKARALLSKTLRIKELLEWKLRTEEEGLPLRRQFVGSGVDLSGYIIENKVEEDDDNLINANPIDFFFTKIPDEYLEEYLNTVNQAYMKPREEEDSDTDSDVSDDTDEDDNVHVVEEYLFTASNAQSREENNINGKGDDDGCHDGYIGSNNPGNSQAETTNEAKLERLYRELTGDKRIEGRFSHKEIANYQYGVE